MPQQYDNTRIKKVASIRPRKLSGCLNLVLILAVTIISFFVGEGIVRIMGYEPRKKIPFFMKWAVKNDVLGWTNKPGKRISRGPGKAPMTFWERGQRATQPKKPRPWEAKTKAVVVGGSFTQGFQVPDEETFTWRLNSWYEDIYFENFGTGGYGTFQSLLMLERYFNENQTPPDLIIYGFCFFHEHRNVGAYEWLRGFSLTNTGMEVPYASLKRDGTLERQACYAIKSWPLEEHFVLVRMANDAYYRYKLNRGYKQRREITCKLMSEMDKLARENGSRFLVAVLYDLKETGYKDYLKFQEIDYIDCCYPAEDENWFFTKSKNNRLRVAGKGHPKGLVHNHWARCIKNWIDTHLRKSG